MASVPAVLLKVMSPRLATKAMQAFDRATIVVVATCWAAAAIMLAFAVLAVMASSSAHRSADEALTTEPVLPKIVRNGIEQRPAQILLDRMQHRYPNVTFNVLANHNLKISASDGTRFRDWLMALSYIDTVSPEYHWTIQDFCVGKCRGDIMSATLAAEKISFTTPDKK